MLTDRVAEPALQVLTTNSEGTPGGKGEKKGKRVLNDRLMWCICVAVVLITTCASSLQSRTMCCHHARVSNQPWVPHSDVKGASRNVAPIELDIYGVDSILPWNEADRVLVCTTQVARLVINDAYIKKKQAGFSASCSLK